MSELHVMLEFLSWPPQKFPWKLLLPRHSPKDHALDVTEFSVFGCFLLFLDNDLLFINCNCSIYNIGVPDLEKWSVCYWCGFFTSFVAGYIDLTYEAWLSLNLP